MGTKIFVIFLIFLAVIPSSFVKSENPQDYSELGKYYYGLNEFDKSIYYYTKAIELDPYNDENYLWRSLCYERKENYVRP